MNDALETCGPTKVNFPRLQTTKPRQFFNSVERRLLECLNGSGKLIDLPFEFNVFVELFCQVRMSESTKTELASQLEPPNTEFELVELWNKSVAKSIRVKIIPGNTIHLIKRPTENHGLNLYGRCLVIKDALCETGGGYEWIESHQKRANDLDLRRNSEAGRVSLALLILNFGALPLFLGLSSLIQLLNQFLTLCPSRYCDRTVRSRPGTQRSKPIGDAAYINLTGGLPRPFEVERHPYSDGSREERKPRDSSKRPRRNAYPINRHTTPSWHSSTKGEFCHD